VHNGFSITNDNVLYYSYLNELALRAFSVKAPSVWKSLPTDLRRCSNTNTYKQHLKTHLFRLTAYTPPSASVFLNSIGAIEILL